MIDQYFTPTSIAIDALTILDLSDVKTAADFAVGDGSLLKALSTPINELVGLDLDGSQIKFLKKQNPDWCLTTGNFIDPSRKTKKWLKQWKGKLDLVLLNPPFSYRGGEYYFVEIKGKTFKCRVALKFVFTALEYLDASGRLVAILPLSLIKSDGDAELLHELSIDWNISFGKQHGRNTFSGCFPKSIVLTFNRKHNAQSLQESNKMIATNYNYRVEIIRGSTQMHKTFPAGKFRVIHSTNLEGNAMNQSSMLRTNRLVRTVSGTFLCIPRVGNPDIKKVSLVETKKVFVLSDCIIGLRGRNVEETVYIMDLILLSWSKFKELYNSTCAPYVTLKQIQKFFSSYGVDNTIVDKFEFREIITFHKPDLSVLKN